MRRLGDLEMDSRRQPAASHRRCQRAPSPDYAPRSRATRSILKELSERPGQRPRALPAGARARAGRRTRDGAARRSTGWCAEYPTDAAPRRSAVPPRRDAVHDARVRQGRSRPTPRCSSGDRATPFHERALYMQGWSQFKQGRLEDGAAVVLRRARPQARGPRGDEADLDNLTGLTRADRELVEDTFRVTSIASQNLQGAESIPRVHQRRDRREATSSASTSSSASCTSSRTASRTRPTRSARSRAASRCTRRRRCCRRA